MKILTIFVKTEFAKCMYCKFDKSCFFWRIFFEIICILSSRIHLTKLYHLRRIRLLWILIFKKLLMLVDGCLTILSIFVQFLNLKSITNKIFKMQHLNQTCTANSTTITFFSIKSLVSNIFNEFFSIFIFQNTLLNSLNRKNVWKYCHFSISFSV